MQQPAHGRVAAAGGTAAAIVHPTPSPHRPSACHPGCSAVSMSAMLQTLNDRIAQLLAWSALHVRQPCGHHTLGGSYSCGYMAGLAGWAGAACACGCCTGYGAGCGAGAATAAAALVGAAAGAPPTW